jgi:uncharacterized RDD family membrane protein YckC
VDATWPEARGDELAVVSPEGTTVRFRIASVSDRASAFVLDLVLTQVATVAVALIVVLFVFSWSKPLAMALVLIVSFFFRNIYFAASELLWSGQTIGKKKMGLRVIARDGGPLTGQAILARNLTREIEFFLPLVALLNPTQLLSIDERWALLLACGWLAVFVLLPLLNREHLRCGDLVGGTVVVALPEPVLLPDLAGEANRESREHAFSPAQLSIYGIEELQVLEKILHRANLSEYDALTCEVASRIQRKIGWTSPQPPDPVRFLRDFYEALRAELERKLLFGVRKERKEK